MSKNVKEIDFMFFACAGIDRLQYFSFIERSQSHAFFPDFHLAGHPYAVSASRDTLAYLHHGDR